jgi:hypothetical protein
MTAEAAAAAAREAEKTTAPNLTRRHAVQAEVRMKGAVRIGATLLLLAVVSLRGMLTSPLRVVTTTTSTSPFRCEALELEEAQSRGKAGESDGALAAAAAAAAAAASPLESLYAGTANGTKLMDWLLGHARKMYPEFQDEQDIHLGNPSLVGDPRSTKTVASVMVQSHSKTFRNMFYLMLCDVRAPLEATACQDSGFEHFHVPPECDLRYWLNPQKRAMYGHITQVGPVDPRLYFDQDGNLGATAVMRGCHPETGFGNHTPIHSVFVLSWKKKKRPDGGGGNNNNNNDNNDNNDDDGLWRVAGLPKLLDLRGVNNSFLGDSYPSITKSWISIPGPLGHPSPKNAYTFRFSLGWTGEMRENVVYKVAEATQTRYGVVPVDERLPHSRAALAQYRASTNLVPFRGGLLGMGHRRAVEGGAKLYLHYWYVMCPDAPHQAVACSDEFRLSPDPESRVNFALGLAADERGGGSLYLAWSENDRVQFLNRYPPDDILQTFRNSAFARSRGGAYLNVSDGFGELCREGSAVDSSITR